MERPWFPGTRAAHNGRPSGIFPDPPLNNRRPGTTPERQLPQDGAGEEAAATHRARAPSGIRPCPRKDPFILSVDLSKENHSSGPRSNAA